MLENRNDQFMMLAVAEGKKCVSSDKAFNVGAIITRTVQEKEKIVSAGFSREIEGNTHAEECALLKSNIVNSDFITTRSMDDCSQGAVKDNCTIYTTMEPCSIRTSGNRSCTSRIIASGIKKVVIGVKEPSNFVKCEGIDLLQKSGIKIEFIDTIEVIDSCKLLNMHLTK